MKFNKPSLTQQNFKEGTDINKIVSNYMQTGKMPVNQRAPIFGDFSSLDFHQMQNRLLDVQAQFQSLPAKLRARFANSPYQLIRFVENPDNYQECLKLGLIIKPVPDDTEPKGEGRESGKDDQKKDGEPA